MRVSCEEISRGVHIWKPCYFQLHLATNTLKYSFSIEVCCSQVYKERYMCYDDWGEPEWVTWKFLYDLVQWPRRDISNRQTWSFQTWSFPKLYHGHFQTWILTWVRPAHCDYYVNWGLICYGRLMADCILPITNSWWHKLLGGLAPLYKFGVAMALLAPLCIYNVGLDGQLYLWGGHVWVCCSWKPKGILHACMLL